MGTEREQDQVLVCLLSADSEQFLQRMPVVLKELDVSFFSERRKVIFTTLRRFYLLTLQKLPWEKLEQALRVKGIADAEIIEINLLFNELAAKKDDSLLFNVELLKESTRQEEMAAALVESMEILKEGKKKGNKDLFGYEDARKNLTTSLARLDKVEGIAVPDGNINDEGDGIMKEYAQAKVEKHKGMMTGILEIDALTGGLKKGEFVLMAGYAGDCKTTACINIMHHLVYNLKKNVVYATGETLRHQVRRKLLVRRSRAEIYGYRTGLPYKQMELGELTPREEQVMKAVVEDMHSANYGKAMVFQFPYKATVEYVRNRLSFYETDFPVDVLFVDEARLVAGSSRRDSTWEELDDVLKSLKQLAVTYNHGEGLLVISPYQVNRRSWEAAMESDGYYKKNCLANSSEAERSADFITGIFRDPKRAGEIQCSVLKYRDGSEGVPFTLDTDLNHCYVGSHIGG